VKAAKNGDDHMKMPTIGLITIICLLFASQAPANPIPPLGGKSASLDRQTEEYVADTCPEEASETSENRIFSNFYREVKQVDKQSCEDIPKTTYRTNEIFYDNYDTYSSIVTYRRITFLPGNDEADRTGMTLYELTDMMSVCREPSDSDMDEASAAPPSAVKYKN
jgi:hypothetical protein